MEQLYEVKDSKNDNVYLYSKDNKIIGYAIIDILRPNDIYVCVDLKYRGNGYGTSIFKLVLKKLKENGIKDIKLVILKDNLIMTRIVKNNNGILIADNIEASEYIIEL